MNADHLTLLVLPGFLKELLVSIELTWRASHDTASYKVAYKPPTPDAVTTIKGVQYPTPMPRQTVIDLRRLTEERACRYVRMNWNIDL